MPNSGTYCRATWVSTKGATAMKMERHKMNREVHWQVLRRPTLGSERGDQETSGLQRSHRTVHGESRLQAPQDEFMCVIFSHGAHIETVSLVLEINFNLAARMSSVKMPINQSITGIVNWRGKQLNGNVKSRAWQPNLHWCRSLYVSLDVSWIFKQLG